MQFSSLIRDPQLVDAADVITNEPSHEPSERLLALRGLRQKRHFAARYIDLRLRVQDRCPLPIHPRQHTPDLGVTRPAIDYQPEPLGA